MDWFTSETATSAVVLTVGYKVVWINLDSMFFGFVFLCVQQCASDCQQLHGGETHTQRHWLHQG